MIIKKFIDGKWLITNYNNFLRGKVVSLPVSTPKKEDDEWEIKAECVTECSKAPKDVIIYFDPIVMAKIDSLMKKYPSREWLGYLIGKSDNPFNIMDLVIPVQTATSAHVDNVKFPKLEEGMKVLGVIHSHHNMGVHFSGTDDKWINQNHDISVLVSHTDMKIQVRVIVPCGAKKIMEAKPKINYNLNYDEESFLKNAMENIKDHEHQFQPSQSYDDWYNRYCGDSQEDFFDWKKQSIAIDTSDKELSLEEELIKEFSDEPELPIV
ncbi:MAG TPA: Mov34/MPN/PAD-1 family protein [Bacteroidales bacterium]|nr:Mov34/MPN/PAD-1 family protein [Bacteroidales bacterium]